MSSYKKTITLGLDYSEFEGGIKQCNSAMKNLDAEFKLASTQMEQTGTKAEKLGLKEEYLTQKIALQQKKVEEAKKKYNALMDAHADTSKIDVADRALLKERTTLQQLENQLQSTTLEQSKFKENATALAAVVAGFGTALYGSAKSVAEYADNINTMSNNTGVAVESLQKLEYASDYIDVPLETMTDAMKRVAKNIDDAGNSSTETGQAFSRLGINVRGAGGEFKSTEDIFYETIDALGRIENQTDRDNIAMTLFGKNAQDLAGAIDAGSKGLKEYGEQAERLGLVMNAEEIQKANEFQDAIDGLSDSFNALKNNVGLKVIPILTGFFETIASIPQPILTTITIIVGLITTIVLLTKTVNSTMKAAEGISGLIAKFTSVQADPLAAKITGITLLIIGLVAAITALIAVIGVMKGKSKELQSTMNSIGGAVSGGRTNVGHNARGTQSWRGGATWVGENGPEIVDLPEGTRIYNNKESEKIGSKNYIINMNCDLSSMRSLNDVIDAVTGIEDSVGLGVG